MNDAINPHGAARPDRDRRLRQADRLGRILNVLRLIQGRGKWNAKSIASELEVTERTVYRDLQALEFAGVPWFYDAEEQSYRVRADYRFPVPNLTDDELIGQAVATAITKATGLDVAGSAAPTTQKIVAVSDDDAKQLLADTEQIVCVLGLQLADHSRHRETIQRVQRALIQKQRICGTYSSPYESKPVELHLNPVRLCLIKNAWYLIGQSVNDNELRTYRIARFDRLDVLNEAAVVPGDFDLKAYFGNAWAVYRGAASFDVRIRFLAEAARIVTETQWHATQQATPMPDGSLVLSFQIDGLEEICNWILGWSGRAEVLAPKELRRMVADQLRSGLALNR
jgi:predicted DNA-binding transcriptional regulator YafY